MRACAGPEPGSSMPHGARRACRAAARGMQTETPPKQAALARQVRQRMNRLGKPEHRARFCFFSKKKSPAGMRRFRIPSKIQIRMGFNRSAASFATPKTFLQSPSFAGACATAPAETTAFAARFASPRTLGRSHCAHAQGQSRVQACRTLREACAAPAAWGMQTETLPKQAALARQVRQRMNRLGKPEHRAHFSFFSKKKSRAGTRRFSIP